MSYSFLKCLQSSSSTIYQAKQFAFLGILNKFMDDKIVSDYEELSISKFAEALELKKDDIPLVELEIVTVIDNINSLLNNEEVDDSAIMTLIKELQEMSGVIDNYKKLLDSSGISSQNITNGIEKLKGMFVSHYYQLLKGKKDLSQSDILKFSKYTSQIGTQQEWIKYYTDLLEETGKDNIIEQSFLNGNPIPIENPPVIMKKGEKAYFATVAEVTEVATQSKTHRLYAGTRVKLGGLPIYVGGSTPITTSREYLKSLGEADFVITNRRIIISGERLSYIISLDNLIDLEVYQDAIELRHEGRYSGRGYIMKKPGLAALVIQTLLSQQDTA